MSFQLGHKFFESKQALLGSPVKRKSPPKSTDPAITKMEVIARIIFTAILLIAAILSISFNVVPDTGKFVLGAIVGYWLG